MKKTDDAHRQDLVKAGKRFHELGFCPSTSGNISVRLDAWRVMITPTGVSKGDMKPEDMVVISPKGEHRFGRKKASSEKQMHLLVYSLRPEVGAVVHAHPAKATAFACAGLALDQNLATEFTMMVGPVPLAKYGTPGTPDLAASLEGLIPKHNAVLMGNHGVVAYGRDIFEAVGRMEMVEHFAEIVQGTLLAGRQTPLSPEDLAKLSEAARRYSQK
ncbi:MAG: class II aldolase/adducin family protein [Elusimicrobiota bacterium]